MDTIGAMTPVVRDTSQPATGWNRASRSQPIAYRIGLANPSAEVIP
jgi:hypothetical protein